MKSKLFRVYFWSQNLLDRLNGLIFLDHHVENPVVVLIETQYTYLKHIFLTYGRYLSKFWSYMFGTSVPRLKLII